MPAGKKLPDAWELNDPEVIQNEEDRSSSVSLGYTTRVPTMEEPQISTYALDTTIAQHFLPCQ